MSEKGIQFMRINTQPVFCALFCCTNLLFGATTNYLDTAMKLRNSEEFTKYVRSLPEDAVWQMASEAYEKGWNEYGIAVGIIGQAGPSFDWEKHPPTREKLANLIENQNLHPGLRAAIAASGFDMVAGDWKIDEFLSYSDVVMVLLQDPKIPYQRKWKIPDAAARGISNRMETLVRGGRDRVSLQSLDALHCRATKATVCLTELLMKAPDTPENSLGDVCGGLMDFVGLYHERSFPSTQAGQRAAEAAKAGRDTLIQVLRDPKYSAGAAKVILRRGDTIKLSDSLTKDDFTRLKSDGRLTNEYDQKLVNLWEQRAQQSKAGTKTK